MANSSETTTPITANSFLNTLGVDVHMPYTDGAYADVSQVITDLKYLGIDQVRDGISNGLDANGNPDGAAPLSTYMEMAKAGIKFTFIIEATSASVIQTQLALINQVEQAVPGSVLAIEGPNEINNAPITFNGVSGQQGAINAQQALYAAVKADTALAGVPVDYFTGYGSGGTDPTTTPGLANYDNQHPYPNFGQAPAFWVSRAQALNNLPSADVATAPAVYTETGYSTDQVPTDVQEKYTLDLIMDTASEGIHQTYLYDLLDAYAPGSAQGDDGFGLFDYTKAAKPVATALHNLTSLLQDSGGNASTFTPTALTYSISGLPSDGYSMVLQKSNGAYELAIWAEPQIFNVNTNVETAAPTENVTVTLPQSFGSVQVFDPTVGTAAIAGYSNTNSVTVAVSASPILIELSSPPVTPAASNKLVLNVSEDAYKGDAQFIVTVDGVQVGGVQTATALHANGQSQNITLSGSFGSGPHVVGVDFLNDLYGGSRTADRNLYVKSITLGGQTTVEYSALYKSGTADFTVGSGQPANPVLTIAAPTQVSGATKVTLTGTVADAQATTVEVLDGATVLGAATVRNGAWSYTTGSLSTGNATFSAIATDAAGNSATATDAAFTVKPVATTTAPTILATVANATGAGLATESVSLGATSGTYVATSTSGVGANPLVLFNWNPSTQLASFRAAVAAGHASIVTEGDSTTLGFGSASAGFRELSYSAEMAQALAADGVPAESDSFLGGGNENGAVVDTRISLVNGAINNYPWDAGGDIIETQNAGDGFNFTLNSPGNYNRLTVSYFDGGTGTDAVSVVSANGTVTQLGAITTTGTGATLTKTFDYTAGEYQEMTLSQTGSAPTYIQGASFWSTTSPAIQVENAGIGGQTAQGANASYVFDTGYTGSTAGAGSTAGVAALDPSLAIVDFGINDIDNSSVTGESIATMVSNYEQIVMTLKNAGADVIIMTPAAWSSPYVSGNSGETYYQQDFPTVLADLETFALQQNIPIIDQSATYGNNYASLAAAGLLSGDNLHPDATLYADEGSKLAALLTNAINNGSSSNGIYVTESASANNAAITGAATVNTLTGTGSNDTYIMNAGDQSDTIVNGSSAASAPSGTLEVEAGNHNQLWFEKSGNNLVIDVLGTNHEAMIQNWFVSNGNQLNEIVGSDGYTLSNSNVQALVQAMTVYSSAHASFNPAASTTASLTNSDTFGAALTTAVSNAWKLA